MGLEETFEAAEGDLTQKVGEKKVQTCALAARESAALLDCVSPLPCWTLPFPPTLPLQQAEGPPLSPHPEGLAGSGVAVSSAVSSSPGAGGAPCRAGSAL